MEGFIKLHRKIVAWEWYQDANTRSVFIHLLLMANYEPKKWRGRLIERGQRITSLANLSSELGLTIRQTRTALKHLETTGEVTRQTTSEFTILTLCNYDSYQSRETPSDTPNDTPNDKQTTRDRHAERQAADKRATTNKKEKKEKKKEVKKEDLLSLLSSELEKGGRSTADVILISDAYARWIDHRRGTLKRPMNEAIIRRDAGRCCGLRTQRKKISPPGPMPPAAVLVELLEASMCNGTWQDWFFDEAYTRLLRDDADKEAPRRSRAPVDPFGNGDLVAPAEFPG